MEFHFKFSDHAEVSTPAAQSPKKIGIFRGGGVEDGSIGDDKRDAFDVVAGEAVQAVQPARAAAEDESCRSGVRHHARRKYEPESLGRNIYVAEKATAAETRATILFIDAYLAHAAEIDHQAALATAEPGKAVPAATDCRKNAGGARCSDNSLNIGHVCATRNQTRCAS